MSNVNPRLISLGRNIIAANNPTNTGKGRVFICFKIFPTVFWQLHSNQGNIFY